MLTRVTSEKQHGKRFGSRLGDGRIFQFCPSPVAWGFTGQELCLPKSQLCNCI